MSLQETELFEPGEYLDQRGPGFFSILAKPQGRARQASYELELLPQVVKAADPDVDTWITQAVFNQANRRAVNMQSVGLLFSDLDTYHVEGLRNKSPEDQAHELGRAVRGNGDAEIPVADHVEYDDSPHGLLRTVGSKLIRESPATVQTVPRGVVLRTFFPVQKCEEDAGARQGSSTQNGCQFQQKARARSGIVGADESVGYSLLGIVV